MAILEGDAPVEAARKLIAFAFHECPEVLGPFMAGDYGEAKRQIMPYAHAWPGGYLVGDYPRVPEVTPEMLLESDRNPNDEVWFIVERYNAAPVLDNWLTVQLNKTKVTV